MSDRGSDKLFEFAREVNHYCELRPDSELAKIKVVPSYILVGDQSSGKTSLLSRLARLPLGYTANKTGTRRPVEYNLIHDDSKPDPDIEVNSKKVAVADFLNVMIKENGTEGFNDSAVSVKILWKDIPESVIVADMPGMKDGDNAPENMILRRLKNANVIPVVILEPKDFDSKHFAFDLLKKAGRSYADIIAVVNKCDEKMAEKGQWSNQSDWTDFWDTAKKKGFKKICITGWPCSSSDRNSSDLEKQRKVLGESCEQEDQLIQEWKRRVNVSAEALEAVGLDKFRQMLHRDQSARLGELCSKSLPQIRRENAEVQVKLQEMRSKSRESLKKLLSKLMHDWAFEASELLDGKVDVHDFLNSASTAEEDVLWLSKEGGQRFQQLPGHVLHRIRTEQLLEGSLFAIDGEGLPADNNWINAISYSVFAAQESFFMYFRDEKLLGKGAFERILDVVFTASLCRIFQHALMEFDTAFINNILAENSQDSGNKVIQQFVKRVLSRTLHPMVDVLSLLIWKHLEICFTLSYKPSSTDAHCLKEVGLQDHFDSCAQLYAHSLVKNLNQELHERLEEHGELLQARCRNGKSHSAIANNFSGNTFPDDEDETKYNDLSQADFCSAASGFLHIGMDVLSKASDKCRRNIRFYEILELAAVQIKLKESKKQETHELGLKKLFRRQHQVDAISAGEVKKLRSSVLHLSSGKTIQVKLDVEAEKEKNVKEAPTEKANGFFGRSGPGCIGDRGKVAEETGDDVERSIEEKILHQRSDEKILQALLKPEDAFCMVALNDFKDGKWLTGQMLDLASGEPVELTFQADDVAEATALDTFVTLDILCQNVKVTIKSVSCGTGKAPETNVSDTPTDSSTDGIDDAETTEAKPVNEVMKTTMKLVSHMSSNFKPLQGFGATGLRMDFRKLMVDLSCELVEQTVSFRELLEKRLQKLKLTAKKHLGHEMTTMDAAQQVLETICKDNKKQVKKLETYEKILRKALDLHEQYANPDAAADSDSD